MARFDQNPSVQKQEVTLGEDDSRLRFHAEQGDVEAVEHLIKAEIASVGPNNLPTDRAEQMLQIREIAVANHLPALVDLANETAAAGDPEGVREVFAKVQQLHNYEGAPEIPREFVLNMATALEVAESISALHKKEQGA